MKLFYHLKDMNNRQNSKIKMRNRKRVSKVGRINQLQNDWLDK
jgi:hypothetical protein